MFGYTAFRYVTPLAGRDRRGQQPEQSEPSRLAFTVLSLVTVVRGIVPLVAATECVGIITLTGVGRRLPATTIPLAEQGLFLALVLIVVLSNRPRVGTVLARAVAAIRSGSGCAWPSSGRRPCCWCRTPPLVTWAVSGCPPP